MQEQSDAFMREIIASPDDDAPRLVFADWLDDHGDPVRAEFIRVQCRLAEVSPAHPEWANLTLREHHSIIRLVARFGDLAPAVPPLLYFGSHFACGSGVPERDQFHRGFPFFVKCQRVPWTTSEQNELKAALALLLETSTIRALHIYDAPLDFLAKFLDSPLFAQLRGFAFQVIAMPGCHEEEACYHMLGTSPTALNLRQLTITGRLTSAGVRALAAAKTLTAVRSLSVRLHSASSSELGQLLAAPWIQDVREFFTILPDQEVGLPVLAGVGELPKLHTLEIGGLTPDTIPGLAAGRFPALERVRIRDPLTRQSAAILAGGRFPSLAVLELAHKKMNNAVFLELLRADWFERLRVLDLAGNSLGPKGLTALANHPVAQGLRVLDIGNNPLNEAAVRVLTRPGAFPELTTLDLTSYETKPSSASKLTQTDLVAFLSALELPRLRCLTLCGLPLGDAGAKVIARSPAFASLTRLNLRGCGIGMAGADALRNSPHLQSLEFSLW